MFYFFFNLFQALARPVPDDLFQEFLESIKSRFNKALNQVQELANRALESIKGSLLNSFDVAQNATKEGIEYGKGLAKAGEASAKKFIDNTNSMFGSENNSTEQVPMMNAFLNEIHSMDLTPIEEQYSRGTY